MQNDVEIAPQIILVRQFCPQKDDLLISGETEEISVAMCYFFRETTKYKHNFLYNLKLQNNKHGAVRLAQPTVQRTFF